MQPLHSLSDLERHALRYLYIRLEIEGRQQCVFVSDRDGQSFAFGDGVSEDTEVSRDDLYRLQSRGLIRLRETGAASIEVSMLSGVGEALRHEWRIPTAELLGLEISELTDEQRAYIRHLVMISNPAGSALVGYLEDSPIALPAAVIGVAAPCLGQLRDLALWGLIVLHPYGGDEPGATKLFDVRITDRGIEAAGLGYWVAN